MRVALLALVTPSPSTQPTAVQTSSVPGGVVPGQDGSPGSSLVDIANLSIQVAVAIVGVVAMIMALLAVLGLRSLAEVRRTSKELRKEVQNAAATRTQIDKRLEELQSEFDSLVLVSHLFNEGQSAYNHADYPRAAAFFREALEIQSDNAKIKIRLARTYINQGLNALAKSIIEDVSSEDPDNADIWRTLSTANRYTDHDKAVLDAQKAINLDSGNPENWNYLGLLLRDRQQFDEALEVHRQAERLRPDDPITIFYQGLLLLRVGATDSSHVVSRAFRRVEELREIGRIKSIWGDTIEWAYQMTSGSSSEAEEIASRLANECGSIRNRQAILQHFVFYLRSQGISLETDASLAKFPAIEVAHVKAIVVLD